MWKLLLFTVLVLFICWPKEARLVSRPISSLSGAAKMASYVLLVDFTENGQVLQEMMKNTQRSQNITTVVIREILHWRQDWTQAQLKNPLIPSVKDNSGNLRVLPSPMIQPGQKIRISFDRTAYKITDPSATQGIVLLSTSLPQDGIFFCELDFAILPISDKNEILNGVQ